MVWALAGLVTATVAFSWGLLSAPVDFAPPAQPRSVKLLDEHGRLFATIRPPQLRQVVPGRAMPAVLRDAVVASEDQHFFSEPGVDPIAILRAFWNDVTGGPLQGGSTITQQYVKDVYTGAQRTLLRKLREAALAIRLEQALPKSSILTRYLNTLYLGNGAYGVQAASEFYYGVSVNRLGYDARTRSADPALALARAAVLAGMIPAPSAWNPLADPKAARLRELYSLNRMIASGYITTGEASAAYRLGLPPIGGHISPGVSTIAPEFRDLVARELLARYPPSTVYLDGLTVRTTLDYPLQVAAEMAIRQVLHSPGDPDAALVAIDPRNGDIRALAERKVGGYTAGGFDLAEDASRSSGSTIKPFTLALALEQGRSLTDTVSAPATYCYPTGTCIHNAALTDVGNYTLEQALWYSVNTIYAPLAVSVGVAHVLALAHQAGMDSGLGAPDAFRPPIYDGEALGVDVTPESEAEAFATLVDHGVYHAPAALVSVADSRGTLYREATVTPGRAVMPAKVAQEVVSAMAGVVTQGTGTAAAQPFPIYGKTGTSDGYTDAWFTGCSQNLCIAVWMGYNSPRPMHNVEGVANVFGGTLPAEIFARTWQNFRKLAGRAG